MFVLKNLADTISLLAAPAFNEKIHLFKDIHTLIKEDKLVQFMVIDGSSAKDAITPSSTVDQDPVIDAFFRRRRHYYEFRCNFFTYNGNQSNLKSSFHRIC